jgi:DUF3048 family protein
MRKLTSLLTLSIVFIAGACGGTAAPKTEPSPQPWAPAIVQVENAPGTEPHAGLQQANIVFEYLTEGGITRFTAVYFNPAGSGKIEPVRSARLITVRLVRSFKGVLFFSGASTHVAGVLNGERLPYFTENATQYFARDSSRDAPHNLYTTGDQLAQGVKTKNAHRGYGLWPTGPAAGAGKPVVSISFDQTPAHHVTCKFSGGSYTYEGENDANAGGAPVKISNVVLLQVGHHDAGYTEDVLGANGIDFDLQGTGPATLYRDGNRYDAKWDLSNPDQPLKLLGSNGKQLRLAAGLTWIFVVDPNTTVTES